MSDGQMHLAGKREGIRGELRRNVLGQLKTRYTWKMNSFMTRLMQLSAKREERFIFR